MSKADRKKEKPAGKVTIARRPSLATGRCATAGCTLPAQPGREECAECIRAGLADSGNRRKPFEAKLSDLDAPGAKAGRNKSPAARNKKPALRASTDPDTDRLLAMMEPQGMDGFRTRRRKSPAGKKK